MNFRQRVRNRFPWVIAMASALALLVAPSAYAADDHEEGALNTYWDGETLNLPWDGSNYYQTLGNGYFQYDRVAVPGDWIYRTLMVQNQGPCPGQLTVEILRPSSQEAADTVNHDDTSLTAGRTGFKGMSELHWEVGGTTGSASFADLYDGQDLATVPVATDSELPVKIAYRFPYAETTGKHLGGTSQLLLYDVGLRLQGDYCGGIGPDPFTDAPIAPTDSASPSPSSSEAVSPDQQSASPGSGAGGSVTAAAGGRLPWTGANITFATISALFLIAAGITAAAGARARARRLSR